MTSDTQFGYWKMHSCIFVWFVCPVSVAQASCIVLHLESSHINNNFLSVYENTSVEIIASFEKRQCQSVENKVILFIESMKNSEQSYSIKCSFRHNKDNCSSKRENRTTANCTCLSPSGPYQFVKELHRDDIGQWRWRLYASESAEQIIQLQFEIKYPARVTSLIVNGHSGLDPVVVRENQSVGISCSWIKANPATSVRLIAGNGKLLTESSIKEMIVYVIPAVRCHDTGLLKCEAYGSETNMSVMLLVECTPKFTKDSFYFPNIDFGQDADLHFTVETHTTFLRVCRIYKYSELSGITSIQTLKEISTAAPVYIYSECATMLSEIMDTSLPRNKCMCGVTGKEPHLTIILRLYNVTDRYTGMWRLEVTNAVGRAHTDFLLQFFIVTSTDSKNSMSSEYAVQNIHNNERSSEAIPGSGIVAGVTITIVASIVAFVFMKRWKTDHWKRPQNAKLNTGNIAQTVTGLQPENALAQQLGADIELGEDFHVQEGQQTTKVESCVKYLCQSADAMQVVFFLKGQQFDPETLNIHSKTPSGNTNYLTPVSSFNSTLESTKRNVPSDTQQQNVNNSEINGDTVTNPSNHKNLSSTDDAKCCYLEPLSKQGVPVNRPHSISLNTHSLLKEEIKCNAQLNFTDECYYSSIE